MLEEHSIYRLIIEGSGVMKRRVTLTVIVGNKIFHQCIGITIGCTNLSHL